MGEELVKSPPFIWVLEQALVNEVGEAVRPFGWDPGHWVVLDSMEEVCHI